MRRGPDQAFLDSVRLGQLGQNVAFVDPNDPTVIYVSQPQETFESVKNDSFFVVFSKGRKKLNIYYVEKKK